MRETAEKEQKGLLGNDFWKKQKKIKIYSLSFLCKWSAFSEKGACFTKKRWGINKTYTPDKFFYYLKKRKSFFFRRFILTECN